VENIIDIRLGKYKIGNNRRSKIIIAIIDGDKRRRIY
jgi:hypothetical protein